MLLKHFLSWGLLSQSALAVPYPAKPSVAAEELQQSYWQTLSVDRKVRSVDFNWGSEKIRGVNIGGWLVLEPYITPSIFDKVNRTEVIDEYTLCKELGHDDAQDILQPHWNNFVKKDDFKKIKNSGFNLVRIPIGFWAYDTFGTPYVKGAAACLDTAVDWARDIGLKIIIDLHGASGSQNGYDHSGQKMDNPQFTTGDHVKNTLKVLKTIQKKYAKSKNQDVVIGIELLNEPTIEKLDESDLRQFYRDAYGQTRDVSDTPVIIQDGFRKSSDWNGFLNSGDNGSNVAVDHHAYQVFSPAELALSPSDHNNAVCNGTDAYAGADKWTFVGEWNGAMTDCAKYLRGYKKGACYDNTYDKANCPKIGDCDWLNDLSQWPDEYKDQTRAYIETQMRAYEAKTEGWVWWNFKTEKTPEWDAFALIDAGIMPQPLTDRKFESACSNL